MRNRNYLAPSVVLSVITLLVAVWFSDSQQKPVALFMLVWLTGGPLASSY